MTPKKQVAVMVAIFSALGIGVSVGIIAFGGGFGSGSSIFDPPTQDDVYVVGSQITDGLVMDYTLDAVGPQSTLADADVSIGFEQQGDSWLATFNIVNGTQAQYDFGVTYSQELTKQGAVSEDVRPYLEPVETSIIAVRDMDYGNRDKYLKVSAPWNTIFYGSTQTVVRITGEETITTPAGTFETFVLSYKLAENTSTIHVVKDLPFPVKAEVYDPEDQLLYRYELVNLAR
ncbi:hypothetical protein [Candidatus Nitrososphaera sp. FF02]|uniref:hypothetical protein n=1 Tax=Candidatus Nitrososphaera sp. FF02 TaxID=3398226 RepID=UPI0039EB42E6